MFLQQLKASSRNSAVVAAVSVANAAVVAVIDAAVAVSAAIRSAPPKGRSAWCRSAVSPRR